MPLRASLKRAIWTVTAVSVGAIGLVWLVAWRSPPYYDPPPVGLGTPILTMAEYDSLSQSHPRPYVVEVEASRGGLLLFGAAHTRDPADPELATLRRQWDAFRPTVALVEGRLGFLFPGLMNPVEHYGEMGSVAALARAGKVPIYSWEPPRETEVRRMLDSFPAERVALFYVLRPYFSGLRFGRPADPEGFVEEYRRKRTRYPGLEGTLPSIAAIDSLWSRDFAGGPDWRETTDEYGLPGYLADLFARSNAIRDEHLAAILVDLVRRGERVFAVAGSSHAVKLEPALRATVGNQSPTIRPP
ncbi:MAG: hypothetical protein ACREM9_12410 [Gemmatimonadales bacterium]